MDIGGVVRVKSKSVCIAALLMSVVVTGCSGCGGSASDVTPPAGGGGFETIEDLKEAVESAGLLCPDNYRGAG
jgi:hypothetical protein